MLGLNLFHDQLPPPCMFIVICSIIVHLLSNQAVDSFLCLPRGPNDELVHHKLMPMEWEVLQDLEIVLEVRLFCIQGLTVMKFL